MENAEAPRELVTGSDQGGQRKRDKWKTPWPYWPLLAPLGPRRLQFVTLSPAPLVKIIGSLRVPRNSMGFFQRKDPRGSGPGAQGPGPGPGPRRRGPGTRTETFFDGGWLKNNFPTGTIKSHLSVLPGPGGVGGPGPGPGPRPRAPGPGLRPRAPGPGPGPRPRARARPLIFSASRQSYFAWWL